MRDSQSYKTFLLLLILVSYKLDEICIICFFFKFNLTLHYICPVIFLLDLSYVSPKRIMSNEISSIARNNLLLINISTCK